MMTMNSYFDVTWLRARLRGARLCAFILRGKPLVDPSICRHFFGPVLSLTLGFGYSTRLRPALPRS